MKIGLVGYQGSGKSTLFQLLTGVPADPSLSHTAQNAMAPVPDKRIDALCEIYHPKKTSLAALELVDTPGLSRTHEGNPGRLALIREAGCLVLVIAEFDGSDPASDLRRFEEDLLLADLEILMGRVERLQDAIQKPRPNREQMQAELEAIQPLVAALEEGRPLRKRNMTDEQIRATRPYRLFAEKPRLAVVNVADDQQDLQAYGRYSTEDIPVVAVPIGLEWELSMMSPEEQAEFRREMGVAEFDRGRLLETLMHASHQMLFFTAGPKEVRSWMIPRNATALDAADTIHSDLARGFIRAEVMNCDDLIRLGSERDMKQQHLVRQEPKDYIVQEGEILTIRFSV